MFAPRLLIGECFEQISPVAGKPLLEAAPGPGEKRFDRLDTEPHDAGGVDVRKALEVNELQGEALALGLVNHITAPEGLLPKAFEIGKAISGNPDPMLRMTKDLLSKNACEQDMALAQKRETDYLRACWATPEHKEAVQAFLDKRPARFR